MFHKDANEIMLGKQPAAARGAYRISRAHGGTTTKGADYSFTAMCADSYYHLTHTLKLMRRRCVLIRDAGTRRELPDMVNSANNELSLIDSLLTACDSWYSERTKYLSERTGKVGK